jgi:hypothetical protein
MEMDGHAITVSAADTAIMLKPSVIEVNRKHVIGEKRQGATHHIGGTTNANKRLHTGTVPTANGTDGLTSLHHSTGRDDARLNAASWKKNKCALVAETKNIDKVLLTLEKRKQQCTMALERRRRRQQQQQQDNNKEENNNNNKIV